MDKQQFLILGKSARGRALCELINRATAEPGIFTFGELLSLPNVQEMGGEFAPHKSLLELFCYGNWSDYQAHKAQLPPLTQQHELKLKQLTVSSLALQQKVLPYDMLQAQLSISTVRDLEDFLITDCFYTGLVNGKLDQRSGCLQVQGVASRDVKPQDTPALADALGNWLLSAQALLSQLEKQATDVATAAAAAANRRRDLEKKQDELKKSLKTELERSGEAAGGMMLDDGGSFEAMYDDERMLMGPGGGGGGGPSGPGGPPGMGRSKRRR